jgi:hypothetical protein
MHLHPRITEDLVRYDLAERRAHAARMRLVPAPERPARPRRIARVVTATLSALAVGRAASGGAV